ncbi:bZIP transcription factor [Pyrenophora seminiperda CCB06]|uniref:BZIP transcription factor n=1 Tax=Pyrenophora seminiperda CCB06 TaxID=1302712 RepID=A0A3M7MC13_9PLEO|nr:bZIP transcription factor [Pyrenophora seminiperda CCB06]
MGQIDQSEQTEQMNINKLSESLQPGATSPQDRRDSLLFKPDVRSPKAKQPTGGGRKRRSEYAVPGSARAIYLEKNRKAASKCRNKQKHEQEQLVEKAREKERTNRMLKGEVHVLESELRAIKESVGQHANCQDPRIWAYLQMEANRLAARHLGNSSF